MKNASKDQSYAKPSQLTSKTCKLPWASRSSHLAHGAANQRAVGATIAQDQDPAQRSAEIVAAQTAHKCPDATTALGQEHSLTDTTVQTTGMSTAILIAAV